MAKKTVLVPICDVCGRLLVGRIYYEIDGKDLCIKCTADKFGFTLNLHPECSMKNGGGVENAGNDDKI